MNKRLIPLMLVLCIVAGFLLRLRNPYPILWVDEAETTIAALQVIERGYPYDQYKGKPMFENISLYHSDDPKYAYVPTNYYNTHFERNKGWLTYYYLAAFLRPLGFSSAHARLPFVLLFLPSALVLYAFAKRNFGNAAALLGVALYAFNPWSITYESQARYYALVTLLVLIGMNVIDQALRKRTVGSAMLVAVPLTLLLYTHILTAITLGLLYVIALIRENGLSALRSRQFLFPALISSAAIIPWIFLVRFWEVFRVYPHDNNQILQWFLLLFFLTMVTAAFSIVGRILWNWRPTGWHPSGTGLIAAYILLSLLLKPLLVPVDSFGVRVWQEINPLFCAMLGYSLFRLLSQNRLRFFQNAGICILLLFLWVGVNAIKPVTKQNYDTRYISSVITYLKNEHVNTTTPVYVDNDAFSFLLATTYNVDLVWPIRPSYIRSYAGAMYFVFHDEEKNQARLFLGDPPKKIDDLSFAPLLPRCIETRLTENTVAYYCPPSTERNLK